MDLETLGSPSFMPKNLLGHCRGYTLTNTNKWQGKHLSNFIPAWISTTTPQLKTSLTSKSLHLHIAMDVTPKTRTHDASKSELLRTSVHPRHQTKCPKIRYNSQFTYWKTGHTLSYGTWLSNNFCFGTWVGSTPHSRAQGFRHSKLRVFNPS